MSVVKHLVQLKRTSGDIAIAFNSVENDRAKTGEEHWFYLNLPSNTPEWAKKLLYNALYAALADLMQEIRQTAYNEGWRDAKSKHRRKVTYFDRFVGVRVDK
jgi:cation transport regulator ChaB